jgi:thiamine pyrophosphate-dependent acetolactate synthase large subunit-like protein
MVSAMKTPNSTLDRREAVAALLRDRRDLLVVCGLGSPAYDAHAAGDHDNNFYLWGAMGGAAMIGLGLAQAQPQRRVLVLTGDGEQLMGFGGLATIAIAKPKNLTVVVIDNGHYGETGMQRSATGLGLDLAEIGAAAGFADARTISDSAGVAALAATLHVSANGPRLYVLKVRPENAPRSLPPRDAVFLKNRFRAALGIGLA